MKRILSMTLAMSIGSAMLGGCKDNTSSDQNSSTFKELNGRIAELNEANERNKATIGSQGNEIALLKEQKASDKAAFEARLAVLQKASDEGQDIPTELKERLTELEALRKDIDANASLTTEERKNFTDRLARLEEAITARPKPENAILAALPPMGFVNWTRFQCKIQVPLPSSPKLGAVDGISAPLNGSVYENESVKADSYSYQHFMLDQARALKDSGLQEAGFAAVNVDDCWMDKSRDSKTNELKGGEFWNQGKPNKGFDSDLSNYGSYLHAMGFKFGLYSAATPGTCSQYPGSANYEAIDAATLVKWGVDSLKYDHCPKEGDPVRDIKVAYTAMADAIAAANATRKRKIAFYESPPAYYRNWDSKKYEVMNWIRPLGQMWRVGWDIDNFDPAKPEKSPWTTNRSRWPAGVVEAFYETVPLARYNGPGAWNDADQLVIGDYGLTTDEEKSQFALWSIMGGPLLLSTDVRRLTDAYLNDPANAKNTVDRLMASRKILTNKEIIAVNQDPLGVGGYRAWQSDPSGSAGMEVVVKPLSGDRLAVVILNKSNTQLQTQKIDMKKIGIFLPDPDKCAVTAQDLWDDAGTAKQLPKNEFYSGNIPAHGNAMYRLAASCEKKAVPITPTGQIYTTALKDTIQGLCLAATGLTAGSTLTLAKCNGADTQIWMRDIKNHRVKLVASPDLCLADGNLNTCTDADPKQNFAYYLNGALANSPSDVSAPAPNYPPQGASCLDISGGTLREGQKVSRYACGGGVPYNPNAINQIWTAPGAPG